MPPTILLLHVFKGIFFFLLNIFSQGKSDLAEQVFKAAELVKTPEFTHITDAKKREKEKNSFVKYYKYFLKDFMEGLK